MSKLVSPILYDEYEPDIFTDGDESSPENSESIPKQNEENPVPVDKWVVEKLLLLFVKLKLKNFPLFTRYRFVHITFYLLGTSIMLPWFFFVTCNDVRYYINDLCVSICLE